MSTDIARKSDEELVIYYSSTQDKLAVGELFRRHSLMCFTVSMKYLRNEDAAQDAAMSVFEKLFTDLRHHQILNFKSWLHSVCRNYCLMQLRKPVLNVSLGEETESEVPFMEQRLFLHQEENTEEKEQRLQELEKAVLELKNGQRRCIELFYLRQKSYEEISEITGFSLNEVKSQIQNGKRNLKITLNHKGINLALALIVWIKLSV